MYYLCSSQAACVRRSGHLGCVTLGAGCLCTNSNSKEFPSSVDLRVPNSNALPPHSSPPLHQTFTAPLIFTRATHPSIEAGSFVLRMDSKYNNAAPNSSIAAPSQQLKSTTLAFEIHKEALTGPQLHQQVHQLRFCFPLLFT